MRSFLDNAGSGCACRRAPIGVGADGCDCVVQARQEKIMSFDALTISGLLLAALSAGLLLGVILSSDRGEASENGS